MRAWWRAKAFFKAATGAGGVNDQCRELFLAFAGEPNNFDLRDGLLRCLLCGRSNKSTNGPALNLSRATHDGESFVADARFEASGSL